MKWKLFSTALISAAFVAFPENIIGCGPSEDPYDYYTSFFSKSIVPQSGLQAFHYNGLMRFYAEDDVQVKKEYLQERVVDEWQQYFGKGSSREAIISLLYDTNEKELLEALQEAEKTAGTKVHAKALLNELVRKKDAATLRYLLGLKRSESLYTEDVWEAQPERDEKVLQQQISDAMFGYQNTDNKFLKKRFAFLLCKLHFYGGQWNEVGNWAEKVKSSSSGALVEDLARSYAAGALYRSGNYGEAAYAFSLLFNNTSLNRQDVYNGFQWSVAALDETERKKLISTPRTARERANLIGMLALHGTNYAIDALEQIVLQDLSSPLLPMLVSREISKIEEQYFTPLLNKEKGGKNYYYWWMDEGKDFREDSVQLNNLLSFTQKMKRQGGDHVPFYTVSTAYLHFIARDYTNAWKVLNESEGANSDTSLQHQRALIKLLLIANDNKRIDADVESELYPALQTVLTIRQHNEEFAVFLRNFLTEILAQRYEQQGEKAKAALAYGMADKVGGWWSGGIDYIHEEMNSDELLALYRQLSDPSPKPLLRLMQENSTITRDEVANTMGTSYLREHNFAKAIEWLKQMKEQDTLGWEDWDESQRKMVTGYVDPFYDYVNDSERYNKSASTPYTKLSMARKMLSLQQSLRATANKEALAKIHYQLANGFYNLSFYGNSHEMVDYWRSSSNWNTGEYEQPWHREYYGVYKAREHFQKAYELSANKEFKAACYFLVIKCAQRQIPFPQYFYFGESGSGDSSWQQFKYSPLFPRFQKEFGGTKYFKYVYERCSYLQDYMARGK